MTRFCNQCGLLIDEGASFCPGCGKKIATAAPAKDAGTPEKPKVQFTFGGMYGDSTDSQPQNDSEDKKENVTAEQSYTGFVSGSFGTDTNSNGNNSALPDTNENLFAKYYGNGAAQAETTEEASSEKKYDDGFSFTPAQNNSFQKFDLKPDPFTFQNEGNQNQADSSESKVEQIDIFGRQSAANADTDIKADTDSSAVDSNTDTKSQNTSSDTPAEPAAPKKSEDKFEIPEGVIREQYDYVPFKRESSTISAAAAAFSEEKKSTASRSGKASDSTGSGIVGVGSFFWLDILFKIPVIGFIFEILFCFIPKKKSLRHFAVARLIKTLLITLVLLLIAALMYVAFSFVFDILSDTIGSREDMTGADIVDKIINEIDFDELKEAIEDFDLDRIQDIFETAVHNEIG